VCFGLGAHLGRSHYVKTHELRSDDWILNAHATLMLLVGAVLLRAALSGRVSDETPLLGLAAHWARLYVARACRAGYPGSTPVKIDGLALSIQGIGGDGAPCACTCLARSSLEGELGSHSVLEM
jgi:hypothetical protein